MSTYYNFNPLPCSLLYHGFHIIIVISTLSNILYYLLYIRNLVSYFWWILSSFSLDEGYLAMTDVGNSDLSSHENLLELEQESQWRTLSVDV